MVTLVGSDLEKFVQWSGESLNSPTGRLVRMDVDQSQFEEFLQATGLRRSVEPTPEPAPKPAPVAPPVPTGDTLPAVRALAAHFEREKAKATEPVPKPTGLAGAFRIAGNDPAPVPKPEQPAPEPTGLASAFRIKGASAPAPKPEQPTEKPGLESCIRINGGPAPTESKPATGGLPIDPEDYDAAPKPGTLASLIRIRG